MAILHPLVTSVILLKANVAYSFGMAFSKTEEIPEKSKTQPQTESMALFPLATELMKMCFESTFLSCNIDAGV